VLLAKSSVLTGLAFPGWRAAGGGRGGPAAALGARLPGVDSAHRQDAVVVLVVVPAPRERVPVLPEECVAFALHHPAELG